MSRVRTGKLRRLLSMSSQLRRCGSFLNYWIAGIVREDMATRLCSRCGRAADFGINFLLSTLGSSFRQQKCSASAPLCRPCLGELISDLRTLSPSSLGERVNEAYTAIASHSEDKSNPASYACADARPGTSEPPLAANSAGCCERHSIACKSCTCKATRPGANRL